MSQISSIALGGLQKASESIKRSANEISSSADIGDPRPVVELKQAEVSFQANAKVLEIDKKLGDYLLDILA